MRKDWTKIKNYYITHTVSLEDLAKKFKSSVSAVNSHCRKEKWVRLKEDKKQEIDIKVAEKTTEAAVNRKVKANEKHNELFNKTLEVAEIILNNYLTDLSAGKKKTNATACNLDFITKAIKNAQAGQRTALNIDTDKTPDTEPEIKIIKGLNIGKI